MAEFSPRLQFALFTVLSCVAYLVFRRLFVPKSVASADGASASEAATLVRGPRPVFGPLTRPLACTLQPSDTAYEKVTADLVRAGIFHKSAPLNFFATRNAAVLIWCIFVAGVLASGLVETVTWKLGASAFGILIMIYGLPRVVLSSRAESRAKQIQQDLPDALDMLTMVMSGGLTIQEALNRVVGELQPSHPQLATELTIIQRQSETGSFDQSMKNFATRMDVPEITALTSMMRHNNRIGGKAVDAMRDFSDSVRRDRQVRAEEQGNKASIKLLMPVVFCLAPPIYIMLLGPALLELRGFMDRENRPGGALQPSVQSAANPGLPPNAQRSSAVSSMQLQSAAGSQPLGGGGSVVSRFAAQFEAERR